MPSSAQLKLATTSSKLATKLPGLLTQPAVAGVGSLDELALGDEIGKVRYYWLRVRNKLRPTSASYQLAC